MTTKTKDWKKKWIGDVIKSDLPDKHPVYLYDNIKSLHLNYDYHLNKLSKITIRQLLDDPKFVYLMLPFIQKVPYFHWTRAELEARKDEIFECSCCEDKTVLEYMSIAELFSYSGDRDFFKSCMSDAMCLSTGVIIHTK